MIHRTPRLLPLLFGAAILLSTALEAQEPLDILIVGGRVLDGAGNPWVEHDIGIRGDRIAFLGNAATRGISARDTVDATGLLVTPGFWDAHSHAELENPHGKDAVPYLTQGITTVVLGLDGGGESNVTEIFDGYRRTGIGVNALRYVGFNAARRAVMGMEPGPPNAREMDAMRAYVRRGMEEGALGLSSGLFYTPAAYATTEEVIEINRVAAEYGGIYDTHDRDLGAVYGGIGYDASVREAIEIAERAGTPLIFSHFNPQARVNYGRAVVGARLIDEARARGVNVMAAQHVYTATQANLMAYAIPTWASAGGRDVMLERFLNPQTLARLDRETSEMLTLRGGAEKIFFVDDRADLNGKTLADVATEWSMSAPEAVRQIMSVANARVMNLDLYDMENTKYLARQDWMMTCTDGRTPPPDESILTHPRPYGAFTRKLRLFVKEDSVISLPFAVRGMTSLASTFMNIPERGLIREGFYADIAIFDWDRLADRATYERPRETSVGTVHVLVNGQFAIRDERITGTLAGRPILRGGGT